MSSVNDKLSVGEVGGELFESWIARFGAVFLALAFLALGDRIDLEKLPPLFSVIISVAAISVGFLGTAKAILISISDTKLMRTLKKCGQIRRLMNYLFSAIWSSLILVVVSASYLLIDFKADSYWTTALLAIWFGITGFALCSNVRLIYNFGKIMRFV